MTETRNVALQAVQAVVSELEEVDQAFREAAARGQASTARHHQLRGAAGCLNSVRMCQPRQAATPAWPMTVVAWNLERCKSVEDSAAMLKAVNPDICLLTEMDHGMARSGNRDTTADLASLLDMGHVFGVEFIELGKGDEREQALHADTANLHGLHGNAILTRFPIDRALLLPLDNRGLWFSEFAHGDQRRIGGRMAVTLRHDQPSPFWVIAVHYESQLGANDRAEETDVLLAHIDAVCGDEPVLIGGDFNCKGLLEAGLSGDRLVDKPETAEPMFQHLKSAGFSWRDCNVPDPTTRNHAWTREDDRALKKIDWFFNRGLRCGSAEVRPAISSAGDNLSDHEAIVVSISL